jgi:Leucine-rich repeat (LRR) protein
MMTLDCSFTSGPFYSIIGNAYQCKVEATTKVDNNYKKVQKINGIHQDINSNKACQMLWTRGIIFHYIPRGIGDHFENLEAIWIHWSGLKELSNLEQFPNLRYIYARHNELTELKSDVFKNNSLIEWIDLKHNNLKFIDGQIFLPFKNMTNLNLKDNYCIDQHYHGKLGRPPPHTPIPLWEINFEININCHRPEEIFCTINNISHQGENFLTCSGKGTDIKYQNSTLFRVLYNRNETQINVTEGFLVRNQHFNYFPTNFHVHLPNLKAIQIIGSGLQELTAENLKNFPELKSLWLPRNNIKTLLDGVFEKNSKLEKLSLYQNELKIINARVLMPLKNLVFVSFENNECISRAAWDENLSELKNEVALKCDKD